MAHIKIDPRHRPTLTLRFSLPETCLSLQSERSHQGLENVRDLGLVSREERERERERDGKLRWRRKDGTGDSVSVSSLPHTSKLVEQEQLIMQLYQIRSGRWNVVNQQLAIFIPDLMDQRVSCTEASTRCF